MIGRDEFFIGYASPMPVGVARFVGRIVTNVVIGVLAWAALIAAGHVPLAGGTLSSDIRSGSPARSSSARTRPSDSTAAIETFRLCCWSRPANTAPTQ